MSESEKEVIRQRLAKLGPDQVRYMVSNAMLPNVWNLEIVAWLAEHDAADREQDKRDRESQNKIALSAERASWIAAYGAIAAVVIGILTIVVTIYH